MDGESDLRLAEPRLKDRVKDVLQEALAAGATDAEASLSRSAGLDVSVRGGELETLEFNQGQSFSITVHIGQRRGSAGTSDISEAAVSETIQAALRIARFTQEDEYLGLADKELLAGEPVDLQLWHPWQPGVSGVTELAKECEAAALAAHDSIQQVESASASTVQGCSVYGNSRGFLGSVSSTRHGISCLAIAEGREGRRQDYSYSSCRRPEDLKSPGEVGAEAGRRAAARLGARRIQGGNLPVLFSPEVSSSLIGHLLGAISGSAIYNKASFLLDALGKPVMSEHLSICEDPLLPGGPGSSWFDLDGVATGKKAIVQKGRLETWLLGAYSARRLGMQPTGNSGGVHNLYVEGQHLDEQELLAELGRGILVTSLMGQGVNLVTGDYSRGASGFLVEDGALQHPVEEITIAANLKDMFSGILAIGRDAEEHRNLRVPSLLLAEMTVAA